MTDDPLARWTRTLAADLGIDLEVDRKLLLEVAKVAAHSVDRPAAPITTFLVGYAAARAGGTAADVEAAAETARHRAGEWDLGVQS